MARPKASRRGAAPPLLARIADIADARFPGGQMSVPYRTRLRLARRHLSPRA
jgi:hypothetical protein